MITNNKPVPLMLRLLNGYKACSKELLCLLGGSSSFCFEGINPVLIAQFAIISRLFEVQEFACVAMSTRHPFSVVRCVAAGVF